MQRIRNSFSGVDLDVTKNAILETILEPGSLNHCLEIGEVLSMYTVESEKLKALYTLIKVCGRDKCFSTRGDVGSLVAPKFKDSKNIQLAMTAVRELFEKKQRGEQSPFPINTFPILEEFPSMLIPPEPSKKFPVVAFPMPSARPFPMPSTGNQKWDDYDPPAQNRGDSCGPGPNNSAKDYSDLCEVKDEVASAEASDGEICVICAQNKRNMILDCKHFSTCAGCLLKMLCTKQTITCPICTKDVQKVTAVFVS